MAAKRVASSAVKWSELADRVPGKQKEVFRAFKAKSDAYISRIQNLPEELPKIDFAFYKSRLSAPALATEFEKMYASLSVPYPKDSANVIKHIEEEEKVALETKNTYVATQKAKIKDNQNVINKLDSIPPPNQMTMQMYAYYFPDEGFDPVKRPTFFPHTDEFQPDTTTIPWLNSRRDKRHLMEHEEWEEMWWKKVEEQNKMKLAESKRKQEIEAKSEGKK